MKNGVITILLVSLIFLSVFVGCNNKNMRQISNTSENFNKKNDILPNFPYSIRTTMSLAIRTNDIQNQYGKPDKEIKKNEFTYQIWYIDESKIVAIYRNDYLIHLWQYNKILERKVYDDILTKNGTYSDVKNIDPYVFLFETDNIAFSEHILSNGMIIRVNYKKTGDIRYVENIDYISKNEEEFVFLILDELNK